MYLVSLSLKGIINEILLPIKLIVPQPVIKRIPGLTTNEEIRTQKVLKFIPPAANCLDIGCGFNHLIQQHRKQGASGLGVDVYPWPGVDLVVENSSKLPFADLTFDCVVFVAALNHIINPVETLRESRRVLKDKGIVIVTTLPPFLSRLWHTWAAYWDLDQRQRVMKDGELYGFTHRQLLALFERAGFKVIQKHVFSWGINNIYIGRKKI